MTVIMAWSRWADLRNIVVVLANNGIARMSYRPDSGLRYASVAEPAVPTRVLGAGAWVEYALVAAFVLIFYL